MSGLPRYRALAPGTWFNKVPREEYERLYRAEILSPLDPRETWDRLHELAGGAEPVLLCWERPPLKGTNWCHRRLIADWFERELGRRIPEAPVP
ncbi:MAG: DUF488 domain-containing protein [Deltaproteobacteria bacterium]|nr:DUF488 domain-containing protein [Deltaproteobacteria bacterium]